VLPEQLPTLQALLAELSALPGARDGVLAAFDALEAGLPARRVAAVLAALVDGLSPERAAYGAAAADALLPPARLERVAGVVGEVGGG
jgi:hypothetical protein